MEDMAFKCVGMAIVRDLELKRQYLGYKSGYIQYVYLRALYSDFLGSFCRTIGLEVYGAVRGHIIVTNIYESL